MLKTAEVTDIAEEIRAEIRDERIQLPTLPEVALEVRDAVENDSADAETIARMVAKDPALAARLLQVANSPVYGARQGIDSLQQAITRMGLKTVRSLVVSLAMKQIFQATSDALDDQFRATWDDSLQVAAISRMLADNVPELDKEQAMLGGLIHNIGALPILAKLDEWLGQDADLGLITSLVDELAPEVGTQILRHWHFNPSLAAIPTACVDLSYDPGSAATYADLVLVARLQHLAAKGAAAAVADWSVVPAFAKVGLEPEVLTLDMEGPAAQIAEVRQMLSG